MKAAIKLLAHESGKRILVLGEMRELGAKEADYHQEIGQAAKHLGIIICMRTVAN